MSRAIDPLSRPSIPKAPSAQHVHVPTSTTAVGSAAKESPPAKGMWDSAPKKEHGPSWFWWILLFVGALGIGYFGYAFSSGQFASLLTGGIISSQASSTPTPQVTALSTPLVIALPTPTPAPTPAQTPTPTATPSATPSPSPAPGRATYTIRILNGTKTSGKAATFEATYEKAGFSVRAVGNAKSQTYTKTFIYYAPGKLDAAKDVASIVKATAIEESATLTQPDAVLVVLGSDV